MKYLIAASFLWSLSFGIIKQELVGFDSTFVSFIRLMISTIVFLPFLRIRNLNSKLTIQLFIIGAIQYGFMYTLYIESYQYLKAYEVALFTIITPLYVIIVDDVLTRNIKWANYFKASLSIFGAFLISYNQADYNVFVIGFLLLQLANVCFAIGQVWYKKVMVSNDVKDHQQYALLFFGGLFVPLIVSSGDMTNQFSLLTSNSIYSLLYLGIIPSGIGFYLWNKGARVVDVDILAVMNNIKIPIAVFITIIIFNERSIDYLLILGTILILAGAMKQNDISKYIPGFLKKN